MDGFKMAQEGAKWHEQVGDSTNRCKGGSWHKSMGEHEGYEGVGHTSK